VTHKFREERHAGVKSQANLTHLLLGGKERAQHKAAFRGHRRKEFTGEDERGEGGINEPPSGLQKKEKKLRDRIVQRTMANESYIQFAGNEYFY